MRVSIGAMRPQARGLSTVRVASLRAVPVRITHETADGGPVVIAENAGAYVRGGKLRLADSRAALLEEWMDRDVATVERLGRDVHILTLADGERLTVQTTGRCACGSALKRFDAFRVNP